MWLSRAVEAKIWAGFNLYFVTAHIFFFRTLDRGKTATARMNRPCQKWMENDGKNRICIFQTVNTNEHLVTTGKIANHEVSREFSNQQWISGNCRVKRCFQHFNHKTPSPSADQPQTDQDRCIYPDNILASVWNSGLLCPANNLFPPHFQLLRRSYQLLSLATSVGLTGQAAGTRALACKVAWTKLRLCQQQQQNTNQSVDAPKATIDTGPKACIILHPQRHATAAPILKHSKWVGCCTAVGIQRIVLLSFLFFIKSSIFVEN